MQNLNNKFPVSRVLFYASLSCWLFCLALAGDRLRGLLVNSTLLVGGTLLISVPVGTLLAVAVAKTSLWGRRWLECGMTVLLFVPLYVHATAWQAAVGQGGWLIDSNRLAGWVGAIGIHGMAAIPWVVLFVAASLRKIPRELEEEALQDAAAWRVLVRVSLRQAGAGIVAAALWISVICFGEIAVTDLFQVRTFAEEIYTAASLGTLDSVTLEANTAAIGQPNAAALASYDLWIGTLSVVLLVLAAFAAIWMWIPINEIVSPASDWIWQMRHGGRSLSLVTWLVVLVIVGIPMLGLLGKAGAVVTPVDGQVVREWSAAKAATLILSSPWQHRREFGWSLAIGAVATVAAVSVATLVAWGIRTRWLPVWPTTFVLALGFAIPGPLLGIWIIRCLNQPTDSVLSPLTWCYDNTILAPALAQFLRALPLTTLVLGSQFASLPQDVLDSAQSEGASWWQQLIRIALPWCWPALVVATCMAMIVSLGDLAATLLVVPPGASPLSVRIFGLLHYGAEDRVSALCLMLILLIGIAATIASYVFQVLSGRTNREH